MRLRFASAVVLLSVFLGGLLSPAACAVTCARGHRGKAQAHVEMMHHHHACESRANDMRSLWAVPCHPNCGQAISALRRSTAGEVSLRGALDVGLIPEEFTSHFSPVSPPVTVIKALDSSGPSLSVLRI
jgi:hypothetical protein